ncbi:PTS sugar transporter subunit IIA [Spiroplasma alleghenense]|uniref:PTS sugar transporter subunit IIA n=1 Tax=Spiroplasma alleghenense TaxID=216931 RepID=UPI001C550617|nr:fructose PTS transporter subunit IIA [Spiroplasma alleghenense]
MKLDVFKSEYIFLDQELNSQAEVFNFIAKVADEHQIANDKAALIKGFMAREDEGSTGFEDGFAIPHARIKEVKNPAVIVIRLKTGIDWNAMDGKSTNVIIALLVPQGPSGEEHLAILSNIAMKLLNSDFKQKMNTLKSKKAILDLLKAEPIKQDKQVRERERERERERAAP